MDEYGRSWIHIAKELEGRNAQTCRFAFDRYYGNLEGFLEEWDVSGTYPQRRVKEKESEGNIKEKKKKKEKEKEKETDKEADKETIKGGNKEKGK